MQIHTDIVDKQKILGARELCRVTRVRSAVSVLSHDTAVQSWEAPCFANCHIQYADRLVYVSVRDICSSVCVTKLEAYVGSCTCNLRNSLPASWQFQIFFQQEIQISNY